MNADRLVVLYDHVAEAPDAVGRLRRFVLDLAVRGKLVEQDPADEPASELLKRIAAERARLVKSGAIRKPRPLAPVDELPFELPSTWEWTRLALITSYIQRGRSPKYAVDTGTPVVSQKCIQWRGLDLSVAKQITLDSLEKYQRIRFLRDGDLLWNSTGTGTIGRVIRLVVPPDKLVCDSHVTVVRCLEVDSEYIRAWLRTDHVYGVIEKRATGATKQVELTAKMANGQLVPLPPLAEQQRIVAKVDELMAVCDRLEEARTAREDTRDQLTKASLTRLVAPDIDAPTFRSHARFAIDALPALAARADQVKLLRQTILDLAVRGKLVEQDPVDEPASELIERITAEKEQLVNAGKIRKSKPFLKVDVRPFSVPVSWCWLCLGEIGFTQTGTTPTKRRPENFGGDIPFIKPSDIHLTHVDYSNEGLSWAGAAVSGRIAPRGSVFMVCIGTIGKCQLIDRPCSFNQQINAVSPYADTNSRFILYSLKSSYFQDAAWAASARTTIAILNKGNWERLPIPVPPLAEQHRIVTKVDELMTLCNRMEASLATADCTRTRLLDSLLHDALASAAYESATATRPEA